VGVADAVHMISKYDDARETGRSKRESILEMLKTLGSATFLTSVTTAVGFASLLSSTVQPMQRFGAYTAAGVLIAYFITILFLPAVLTMAKSSRVFDEKSGSLYPLLSDWLTKITAFNRLHYGKMLIAVLVLMFIFGSAIRNIEVNGKVFDDVGEDTELMQDSRFFTENLSPQFPLEFIINTGEENGALSYDLYQKSRLLTEELLSYPEIHKVTGLYTLTDEVHTALNPDSGPVDSMASPGDAIAQYALLLEINGGDNLFNFVDFDYQKIRLTALTEDAGSKRINEIRSEVSVFASELFDNEDLVITGTTILSADLTEKIVYSLSWSIVIAILVITLIMAGLFKSMKLALIALIPNLIPLIMVAGVMGFFNVDIKPSTAVIFTIALGIAVDDSIHYLARFRIEYARIGSVFPALSTTTVRTGRAIVVTSMILIAGFGTLITSAFTSTAMMGILVTTTIFSALLADLFVLPGLFYWLKPELKKIQPKS
jgi:predicted RND superfamily exporter protein